MLSDLRTYKRLERLLGFARKVKDIEHMNIGKVPAIAHLCLRSGMNVRMLHALHAIRTPDHPALTDERRTLTYAAVNREINSMANSLEAMGVTRKTPVVIALENSVEYIVLWFACLRLGAKVIHASWRSRAKEFTYILEHSGARLVVVGGEAYACMRDLQQSTPSLGVKILHVTDDNRDTDDCMRYDRVLGRSPSSDFPTRRRESAESIVYTSGTTGRPKGAVRDFGGFTVVELIRVLEHLPMNVHDRQLIVTPLYHSAAQAFALIGTAMGASLRIERHFDPGATLRILEKESIHSVFAIPTMMRRIIEAGTKTPQLPELKAVISGSSEFPQALREDAIRFFGAERVFDFYGATELGWVTLIRGDEMLSKKGSVGKPLAGQEIAIFDEKGRKKPAGETGVVYVKNDQAMGGYLNDSRATEAIKIDGNWMTVDDLGHLDQDGYLFLSGRARDMVKSGGVNIYPVEVEQVLCTHPNVREVAVIGLPDKDWGERLVAVIVPKVAPFDSSEAETFLRTQLASFKVPKQWEIVTDLPRNAMGKVIKAELRTRMLPTDSDSKKTAPAANSYSDPSTS